MTEVRYAVADGIATITLDRVHRANAFTIALTLPEGVVFAESTEDVVDLGTHREPNLEAVVG